MDSMTGNKSFADSDYESSLEEHAIALSRNEFANNWEIMNQYFGDRDGAAENTPVTSNLFRSPCRLRKLSPVTNPVKHLVS